MGGGGIDSDAAEILENVEELLSVQKETLGVLNEIADLLEAIKDAVVEQNGHE